MKKKRTLFVLFLLGLSVLFLPSGMSLNFAQEQNHLDESDGIIHFPEAKTPPILSSLSQSIVRDQERSIASKDIQNVTFKTQEKTEDELGRNEKNDLDRVEKRTQRVATYASIDNVITTIDIRKIDGSSLDTATQYTDIRVYFDFVLPSDRVSEGDTTVVLLPDELSLDADTTFNINDENGTIIAYANVSAANKTITLTYTDFVSTNSFVKGTFFISTHIDTKVVKETTQITLNFAVEGKIIKGGTINFNLVEDDATEVFTKYGDIISNNSTAIMYNKLRINTSGKEYSNVVISDQLKTGNITYNKGSFQIIKGKFFLNNGRWDIKDYVYVTNQFAINFSEDNTAFSINFGDISPTDQYLIYYETESSYQFVDGEIYQNDATMIADEITIKNVNYGVTYHSVGGTGRGYRYEVKIKKINEQHEPLAGAVFELIRDRTQTVMGRVVTDKNGEAEVGNLLKDTYTLTEVEAPSGYELLTEPIKISETVFGDTLQFHKEVINTKKNTVTIPEIKTEDDSNEETGSIKMKDPVKNSTTTDANDSNENTSKKQFPSTNEKPTNLFIFVGTAILFFAANSLLVRQIRRGK